MQLWLHLVYLGFAEHKLSIFDFEIPLKGLDHQQFLIL